MRRCARKLVLVALNSALDQLRLVLMAIHLSQSLQVLVAHVRELLVQIDLQRQRLTNSANAAIEKERTCRNLRTDNALIDGLPPHNRRQRLNRFLDALKRQVLHLLSPPGPTERVAGGAGRLPKSMSNEHIWGKWLKDFVRADLKKHHIHLTRYHRKNFPTFPNLESVLVILFEPMFAWYARIAIMVGWVKFRNKQSRF